MQTPHIALVDGGLHLHVAQVFGNHKKLRRLQAGSHGLATLNGAFDDDAVDRRGDAGARQVDARLGQGRLALRHIGLG